MSQWSGLGVGGGGSKTYTWGFAMASHRLRVLVILSNKKYLEKRYSAAFQLRNLFNMYCCLFRRVIQLGKVQLILLQCKQSHSFIIATVFKLRKPNKFTIDKNMERRSNAKEGAEKHRKCVTTPKWRRNAIKA